MSCFLTDVFHIHQNIDPALCLPVQIVQEWKSLANQQNIPFRVNSLGHIYTWIFLDFRDPLIQQHQLLRLLFQHTALLQQVRFCLPPLWNLDPSNMYESRQLEAIHINQFLSRMEWITMRFFKREQHGCRILQLLDISDSILMADTKHDEKILLESQSLKNRYFAKVFHDASRSHWQALLIDMAQHEVNMYDSLGCQWSSSVMYAYVKRIGKILMKFSSSHQIQNASNSASGWSIKSSPLSFHHQRGGTMCGMYVLKFLMSRVIDGTTMQQFIETTITDKQMLELQSVYFYMPGISPLPIITHEDHKNQNHAEESTYERCKVGLMGIDFLCYLRHLPWSEMDQIPSNMDQIPSSMDQIQYKLSCLFDELALQLPLTHIRQTVTEVEEAVHQFWPLPIHTSLWEWLDEAYEKTRDQWWRRWPSSQNHDLFNKGNQRPANLEKALQHWWKTEYQPLFPGIQFGLPADSLESSAVHWHCLRRLKHLNISQGLDVSKHEFNIFDFPLLSWCRSNLMKPQLAQMRHTLHKLQETWVTISHHKEQEKEKGNAWDDVIQKQVAFYLQTGVLPEIQWTVLPWASIQQWKRMTRDLRNVSEFRQISESIATTAEIPEKERQIEMLRWLGNEQRQRVALHRWQIWLHEAERWIHNEIQAALLAYHLVDILQVLNANPGAELVSAKVRMFYERIRQHIVQMPASNLLRYSELWNKLK